MADNIKYRDHINVSSPVKPEYSIDNITLLQNILSEIQQLNKTSIIRYHVIYSIDTSNTTKRKIDIVLDTGNYSIEAIVLDKGSGFNIFINDESEPIVAHTGLRFIDEVIERVYVIGSGTEGTGKIRFGVVK